MKIVFASGNKNKIRQVKEIFCEDFDCEVLSAKEVGFFDFPPEDADSFDGNAKIKAVALADYLNSIGEKDYLVLADDSGLEVDALDGKPGVYSARFAGENATDDENNEKLISILKELPSQKFTARYHCSISAVLPDGRDFVSHGNIEGEIIFTPKGTDGFGYDPYFYISSLDKTFAELNKDTRNAISHRGQGLRNMVEILKNS